MKAESGPAAGKTILWSAPLVAVQFLTTLPPLIRRPFSAAELGASVAFFPLVGLLLGGLLAGAHYLLTLFLPASLAAGLVLLLWIGLTGAIHLDGFLDACDGLFGGFTPAQRLEIMRDERVGAYGLAGGVLLLLLQYSALLALPNPRTALLLAPVLGRWIISLAIVGFPYARPKGLGLSMKQEATWRQALVSTLLAALCAVLIFTWQGLGIAALAALFAFLVARYVLAKIPGLTGDIYGSLCVLTELLVLLALNVRLPG